MPDIVRVSVTPKVNGSRARREVLGGRVVGFSEDGRLRDS